mmetsp:Transcript_27086/g.38107  ORF Transcript_27086/g.38107 Transcript_27086/m.38107 type:complete len:116 (+) Transcript_27086:612-959(+)
MNYDHRKSPRKRTVEPKSKSNYTKSSNQSSRPKEQPVEIKSKSAKRKSRSREPPIGVLIIQPKNDKRVPSSTKNKERPFDKVQRRSKSSSQEANLLSERSKPSKSEKRMPSSLRI